VSGSSRYRDALAIAEFRAIFAAHVISMAGTVVTNFALTVLVYSRTGSPFLAALVFAIVLMPHLVAGTLFSALVDRVPARRLLVSCNLVSAALVLTLALPGIPVPALLLLAFLLGLIEPVFIGTRAATLPDVLPGSAYVPGRSLMRLVAQGAQLVGFALGGLALAVVGPGTVLLVNAGCFVLSGVLLRFGTRERVPKPAVARVSLLRDSVEGLGGIMRIAPLRRVLLLSWMVPALAVVPEALAVPYAAELSAGSLAAGLLLSAIPLGTVTGELLGTWLMSPTRQTRLVPVAACWVFLPLLLFGLHPGLAGALLILFLSGLGACFHLGQDRLLLEVAPQEVRPRALSVQGAGLMFWQGLGFVVAGAAAEFAAPAAVIPAAAVCGLLAVVALAGLRRTPTGHRLRQVA
jgi:predicted MFS family arabinose efflux permease